MASKSKTNRCYLVADMNFGDTATMHMYSIYGNRLLTEEEAEATIKKSFELGDEPRLYMFKLSNIRWREQYGNV